MTMGKTLLWAPLGLLLAATAAAAGASVAAAPRTAPSATTLVGVWRGFAPQDHASVSDPHHTAATDDARHLISVMTVAPGWTAVTTPPTRSLAAPEAAPATANLVDLYELWTTPGTWWGVLADIAAHPPPGSRPVGSGMLAGNGGVLSSGATYGFTATAGLFDSRQLLVEVAPLADGSVGIRVDAQVIWYPSRPRDEFVPPHATTVTATIFMRRGLTSPATVILATRTTGSPSNVRRLARDVDLLPLAIPGPRSCPDDSGTEPQLDLDFSGPPGEPTVVVHDDPNGCGAVSFAFGHTAEAPLTDDGLLRQVEQFLGLPLTAG
jgi:hypothetical protein